MSAFIGLLFLGMIVGVIWLVIWTARKQFRLRNLQLRDLEARDRERRERKGS